MLCLSPTSSPLPNHSIAKHWPFINFKQLYALSYFAQSFPIFSMSVVFSPKENFVCKKDKQQKKMLATEFSDKLTSYEFVFKWIFLVLEHQTKKPNTIAAKWLCNRHTNEHHVCHSFIHSPSHSLTANPTFEKKTHSQCK